MSPERALSDAERRDWLRLARSENVGPATFATLLRHFGTAEEALARAPDLSLRGGRSRPIRVASRADAEAELAALAEAGGRLIASCEPDYPPLLAAIHDPPPVISVLGYPHLLAERALAVVGARNASAAGRRFARDISAELGRAGLTIASGLARGIDAAAHEGALATGTAAVNAGGVDVVYPPENGELYRRIVAEGCVLSEQPFGLRPTAAHFPRRNRLISGLALGVLVIEAAERSGSLITARLALEQGREVLAVPGSPLDPRCRGTNGLIRAGATLVEQATDVIEALAGQMGPRAAAPEPSRFESRPAQIPEESQVTAARAAVVEALGPTPVTVDELVRECHLSPAAVLAVLLELELAGRLERHPGPRVSLVS